MKDLYLVALTFFPLLAAALDCYSFCFFCVELKVWGYVDISFRLPSSWTCRQLDTYFLLAHMCSVKLKEWTLVLLTLLRSSKAYSILNN
ncbi:hypothetical protein Ahy_B03g065123 [Arachis hypogaea]|uniref:Secreted protein n=1 Tax=Arachis hypogaea TaxID=3818 RepID=A0A445A0R8_ARAHY|nr:hypothetical protein Ahy_B03g065123 [Arachis hypogaea]